MPITKLTQDLVNSGLPCPPEKKHIQYCDTEVRGLIFERRINGQATYSYRYKDASRQTRYASIGRAAEITLADARRRAKTLKAEIQLGADPRGEVKAKKAVITLDECFEQYLAYVKSRKRSWKRDQELYRRLGAKFGSRRISEIKRQELQTFHAALLDEGLAPATADHHAKLIRQMLNLAVEWELLDRNPAERIRLFNRDNQVENYLKGEQFDQLMNVLRTDENRAVCRIAMFLLSTGSRLNEALRAEWGQIDRTTRVWRIPASNSKSKRVRAVPLNASALEVLDQVGTEGVHENVFVNSDTGKRYTTIYKVWSRIRKKAGAPWLRIHDLRHQYASFLVNSGRTLYEVQQILGHSDPSVTQRYAHLSTEALQEAANSASVAIKGATPAPTQPVQATA